MDRIWCWWSVVSLRIVVDVQVNVVIIWMFIFLSNGIALLYRLVKSNISSCLLTLGAYLKRSDLARLIMPRSEHSKPFTWCSCKHSRQIPVHRRFDIFEFVDRQGICMRHNGQYIGSFFELANLLCPPHASLAVTCEGGRK